MSQACDTVRMALGAHALGALDPAESEEIRTHLESCPACREELAALSSAASALGQLAATDALAASEETAAAHGLLGRVIAEVARRRRRFRLRLAGAGVVLVLAAAGATTAVTLATHPGAPAAAAHLAGTDPDSGVAASADVYAESWGTSIHMTISGVNPGERCQLVAISHDGSKEVAGSWHVDYSGAAVIDGATGMTTGELAFLRVQTTAGAMLIALRMPVMPSS
jgi:hypothetical protein